jgi:hypothetical protein
MNQKVKDIRNLFVGTSLVLTSIVALSVLAKKVDIANGGVYIPKDDVLTQRVVFDFNHDGIPDATRVSTLGYRGPLNYLREVTPEEFNQFYSNR